MFDTERLFCHIDCHLRRTDSETADLSNRTNRCRKLSTGGWKLACKQTLEPHRRGSLNEWQRSLRITTDFVYSGHVHPHLNMHIDNLKNNFYKVRSKLLTLNLFSCWDRYFRYIVNSIIYCRNVWHWAWVYRLIFYATEYI